MLRLINVHTHELRAFDDSSAPPYAVASHRWYGDVETSYEDFIERRRVRSYGFLKIMCFCAFVQRMSALMSSTLGCVLEWIWIDTCCIKKSDSAELSEAINSMFDWYAQARVCFAYLSDVDVSSSEDDVVNSSWFGRGWTLQELLAPSLVVFIDSAWDVRGHKLDAAFRCSIGTSQHDLDDMLGPDLSQSISNRTLIPVSVLNDLDQLYRERIETVLSWMNNRFTSRQEDQAYCLLGLLNVSMSLVYGEKELAMVRLLEQVQAQYTSELRSLAPQVTHTRTGKPIGVLREELSLLDRRIQHLHDARYRRRVQDRRLSRLAAPGYAPNSPCISTHVSRNARVDDPRTGDCGQVESDTVAIAELEVTSQTAQPSGEYGPLEPPSIGHIPVARQRSSTDEERSTEDQLPAHQLDDTMVPKERPTQNLGSTDSPYYAAVRQVMAKMKMRHFLRESLTNEHDELRESLQNGRQGGERRRRPSEQRRSDPDARGCHRSTADDNLHGHNASAIRDSEHREVALPFWNPLRETAWEEIAREER